ncbi:MAG TPA: hypothetical protein ENJ55_05050 [Rhizobiales bacterium]|nr:hypothetical protein [Hyphomicrobiales bacterium]
MFSWDDLPGIIPSLSIRHSSERWNPQPKVVIPAQAGIQGRFAPPRPVALDSRLRGNDGV